MNYVYIRHEFWKFQFQKKVMIDYIFGQKRENRRVLIYCIVDKYQRAYVCNLKKKLKLQAIALFEKRI